MNPIHLEYLIYEAENYTDFSNFLGEGHTTWAISSFKPLKTPGIDDIIAHNINENTFLGLKAG